MQEIGGNEIKQVRKEDEEHKPFSELPNDVLETIWTNVFADDPGALGVLRCVCKYWKANVKLLPRLTKSDQCPYLVSLKGCKCKFFQPKYNRSFQLKIPELLGASIRFSKYGWLLLSRYSGRGDTFDFFFFNLSTGQKIELPKYFDDFLAMSFWSPPTYSDCHVIGIPLPGMRFSIFRMNGKDQKWKSYWFGQKNGVSQSCHPIRYKKKYYCMLSTGKLLEFDPKTQSISFIGESLPQGTIDSLLRFHLVEDEEDLLAVFVPIEQAFPYVMKMDMAENKWVPVHGLSNKVLYASLGSSFVNEDPTRSNDNKIYFPKFRGSESVFYSLTFKKYETISGDYSGEFPVNVKEMTNCAWIKASNVQLSCQKKVLPSI